MPTARKAPRRRRLNEHLEISGEPSAQLLAMLAEPADGIPLDPAHQPPPGLLELTTPGALAAFARDALVVSSAGALLEAARKRRGLGPRQLAERLGVSRPRVLQLEGVSDRVELQTLVRFADELGFDLQITLLDREGGEPIVAPAPGRGEPSHPD